ncbi:N-acetylmuramoyl-L-alanine amidase [Bacillus sp. AK128]
MERVSMMRVILSLVLVLTLSMNLSLGRTVLADESNEQNVPYLMKVEDFEELHNSTTTIQSDKVNLYDRKVSEEQIPTTTIPLSFIDVQSNFWAFDEIGFLSSQLIINGYETEEGMNEFRPNAKVSRAQAAKMIVIALGEEELFAENPTFSDVPNDHWANGWIEQAFQLNIFTGYEDGTFNPDGQLTRAQMSKVLSNAFVLEHKAVSSGSFLFTDVQDHWASEYIQKLYMNGISNGSNNRFMPESDITRAQFAAFLSRTIDDKFKLPIVGAIIVKGKVIGNTNINVRATPEDNGAFLGRLSLGEVVNIYELNGYWAKILYNNKIGYIHKSFLKLINIDGQLLKDRIIVLDAGHGGKDPGAIASQVYERDIVLNVTKKLQEKLVAAGAKVVMTRTDNTTTLALWDRVDFANKNYAELFISIHANAATPVAKGSEVFFDSSMNDNGYESSKLARTVQKQIVTNASMKDRGVKDSAFYVIRNQDIVSVLVELGFITNEEDAAKLKSDNFTEIYAESIYRGIVDYYNQ